MKTNLRRRTEDGVRGQIMKWAAGIVSSLIVGAISWNFLSIITMLRHDDHVEWALRWQGLWIP